MNKKEKFIQMVESLLANSTNVMIDAEAIEYFEVFKSVKEAEKAKFTENGKKVLQFMKDNKDKYNNMFKAKEIGEGLFISSRAASGAMRKLVTDGYVEKMGTDPVVYVLTQLGTTVQISEEEN